VNFPFYAVIPLTSFSSYRWNRLPVFWDERTFVHSPISFPLVLCLDTLLSPHPSLAPPSIVSYVLFCRVLMIGELLGPSSFPPVVRELTFLIPPIKNLCPSSICSWFLGLHSISLSSPARPNRTSHSDSCFMHPFSSKIFHPSVNSSCSFSPLT